MSRFVLTAQLQLQAPNNVAQVVRQIQNQLNNVTVNVQVQGAAQAQRQLQQVTAQTNAATSAVDRMGRAFAVSVRRFAAFSIATRAVGLFTSTLSDAIKTAIDFEREMVRVSQVTGESLSQLKGFTKTVTNLSTSLGVASSDLVQAGQLILQAGFSAKDTEVALKTLAKAALAPNFDSLSETTEGAIAILAQFGEGVGALEKQLGSINAVAGAFAVEAGDLIDVIRRAGGVFKSSGGDLNELIALFTSVRATTRESAESIGTGLRTIFTRIQRPKTIEFLKQFGVELLDLEGRFVGPFEAVKRLSGALAGLGEGDVTFIRIAEELGGFRQIGKVLPLLQQFTVAQNALNVANKAGNSLTKDAETAQQALAIRIIKVKEEFLALIRGITETKTFQIMANTALSLASALIQIGDAIKPLLPMLATLAAVNLARGIGPFLGSFARGMSSNRTFNKGGKVHHFARGGFVPGTGNRDTVPAMLSPGEFVIRKSSVKKLGASNLAAMNENRYATGGKIELQPGAIGGFFLQPEKGEDRKLNLKFSAGINNPKVLASLGKTLDVGSRRSQTFSNLSKSQQERLLFGRSGIAQGKKLNTKITDDIFNKNGSPKSGLGQGQEVQQIISDPKFATKLDKYSGLGAKVDSQPVPITGTLSSYFPGRDDIESSNVSSIVSSNATKALRETTLDTIKQVSKSLQNPIINFNESLAQAGASRISNDANARRTTEGFIFEGLIDGITGAALAGGTSNFDFPASSIASAKRSLSALFTNRSGEGIDSLIKADAKRSNSRDAIDSIKNKITNDINSGKLEGINIVKKHLGGIIQRFTSGGEVVKRGTINYLKSDVVKAMASMGLAYDDFFKKIPTPNSAFSQFMVGGEGPDAKPFPRTLLPYSPTSQTQLAMEKGEAEKNARIQSALERQGRSMREYEGQTREQKAYMANRSFMGRRRFATGGGVGTDTVPALLTPGEFVIKRSSAQRIGYGNLNRMNKVGRYAQGGVVQKFARGGMPDASSSYGAGFVGSGGLDPSQNLIPFDMLSRQANNLSNAQQLLTNSTQNASKATQQNTQAQQSQQRSAMDVVNNNKMFAASMVTSLIQGFLPAVDENSGALLRLSHSMLGLITTIASVGFALEAFGVSLNAKSIMEFFGSGPNSAGGLLSKGFKSISPQISSLRGGLNRSALGGGINRLGGNISTSIGANISRGRNAIASSSFGRGFAGARQGINPLFSAAMPAGTSRMPQGTMAVQQLKTRIGGLGVGGRLSARLGGLAGNATNAFQGSNFGKGLSAGFRGKSVIGGGSRSIMGNLGGLLGQGAFQAGGIKRGLVSGFQGGRFGQSGVDIASKLASRGVGQAGQVAAKFANVLGKGVTLLPKLLGPMMAIAGSAFAASEAFKAAISAVYNFEGRLKSSIEKGDIEGAKKVAGERASFEGANVVRGGGASAGAIVGFIFGGPIGAAIGAGLGAAAGTIIANGITAIFGEEALDGLNRLFGGNTRESAVALAAAQAGAVKTQKELDKAQKTATMAMEDFENGSISASEALSRIRAASSEVINQEKRASDFAVKNLENRASDGFTGRNVASFLTFGAVESSSQRNERLGKQSAEQIDQAAKFEAQRFQMETGARTATIRSGFARGVDVEEIRNRALGVGTDNDLQKRLAEQVELASTLQDKGDKEGAAAARDSVNQLTAEINQVNREMANLEKEVARTKAAFEAVDLGLRGPIATATAMSASMERFTAGLEVGGNMAAANTKFLAAAMTSAAQAMNPKEIQEAMSDISNNLRKMGASETAISKFEANTNALVQAQQNYGSAFENIRKKEKARIERGQGMFSADDLKKEFTAELTKGLDGPAKKNMEDMIQGMQLTNDEVAAIMGGDRGIFLDKLTAGQKEQIAKLDQIFQERQKAEQAIIQLTQQRIEAERNLVNAQREAVDLYMEGRDVQAKYGGPAVSIEERRAANLAKINAGASRMGLSQMRTGSVAELRARNNQILTGFGGIEARRSVQGGMQGVEGTNATGIQQDLQQAQKEQIQFIRDEIKIREDELKIIQEKNRLEKDSLESLISGDIEKFFEQQAAVGAQAAIATGDTSLANMFGASAVGTAFKDIQRMQEAGVQSLFGRQLGGPGGLAEQAAGAALGARGVMDPRMAQRLAGTTAEEEAMKGRLRELGGVLGETGAIGAAMAEMQVQTASINVANATVKLQQIEERGRAVAAGMYRGGTVYANRGMFVPRGTDTVPAMLTPGEFVVRREAVNRGNNLQLLRAINSGGNAGGFARGGKVGYYNNGGIVQYKALGDLIARAGQAIGIDPKIITNLGNVFTSFTNSFNESIKNLQNTKLQIKLDSVNVNVNLNGTSMLTQISEQTRKEIVGQVIDKLKNEYGVGNNGKLTQNTSNLPKMA